MALAGLDHQTQAAPSVQTRTCGRRSIDAELPLDQVDEGRFLRRENEPTPEDAIALADELEHIFSVWQPRREGCWNYDCRQRSSRKSPRTRGVRGARSDVRWFRYVNSWHSDWKMPDADFESRIHDFEQSWRRNRPAQIADFLLRTPALPPKDDTRCSWS